MTDTLAQGDKCQYFIAKKLLKLVSINVLKQNMYAIMDSFLYSCLNLTAIMLHTIVYTE